MITAQEAFHKRVRMLKKNFITVLPIQTTTHGFSFWGLDVADVLRNNISWGNTSSDIEQVGNSTYFRS